MSQLFSPFDLGPLRLKNRIVIAPMCQYSAEHGNATDWHLIHLGHLALSGAGLLILEATAVTPEGRISPTDLGLWNEANEQALGEVLRQVRQHSAMPMAIQLSHAGRKASSRRPWEGGALIDSGATALGGRIPVNVSGGLLSKGHPIGATGVANMVEIIDQLRGEAGARQVAGAKIGLTHVLGFGNGSAAGVHIFEKA